MFVAKLGTPLRKSWLVEWPGERSGGASGGTHRYAQCVTVPVTALATVLTVLV